MAGSVSKYTDEEKRQLVEKAQKEVQEGWAIEKAAKNAGITYFMYNNWRKRLNMGDMRFSESRMPKSPERHSAVDWAPILQDYEEHRGEITQKAYCQQKGVHYPSFLSARHRLKGKKPEVRTIVPVSLPNGTEEKLRMALAENLKLRSLVVDYALDIQAIKEWAGRK